MKKVFRIFAILLSVTILAGILGATDTINANAAENEKTIVVDGTKYIFGEKSKYDLASPDETSKTSEGDTYGVFEISGAISSETTKDGVPSYGVDGGTLTFTYKYSDSLLNAPEDQTHLVDDKSKTIDGINLDKNIMKGAIIVQTSKDGQIWYTIPNHTVTNIFEDVPVNQDSPLYETTEIQMVNGCYYRIIIAYKTEIKTGTSQVLVFKNDEHEYHQIAEVYSFYAYDQTAASASNPSGDNRKFLGSKVRTAKFEGYQGAQTMNNEDPHFGWDVGQFYVGGYTDCVEDSDGNPIFLKNNGDRVTLWFDLLQDIDKCFGNDKIRVVEDNEGSDAYFEIPGGVNETMDFGHGALIVRHVTEDSKNKPQVYTDFLRATASVDSDAKINLFEEGDYEVALDYAVRFDKTEVFGVSVLPQTAHYRIAFSFSVRNGNTLIFLFDNATGSELSNGAITPNGFRLDFANSQYLKVNVKREVLKDGFDGLTEDTRFNSSATDGEVFTEEGVYTITVTNQYTNTAPTVKRVYVGNNNVLKAYMVTGLSISEINDKVALGATIMDDGTIIEPEPEPEAEPENGVEASADEALDKTDNEAVEESNQELKEGGSAPIDEELSEESSTQEKETQEKGGNKKKAAPILPIVVISLIVVAAAYAYLKRNTRNVSMKKVEDKRPSESTTDKEETIPDNEMHVINEEDSE